MIQPISAYIAYDVDIRVGLAGGEALLNLILLASSFQPRGCSTGDEQYTITDGHTIRLSHLFAPCDAEISLAAQVIINIGLRI